jgi:membrane protease subunit HflK
MPEPPLSEVEAIIHDIKEKLNKRYGGGGPGGRGPNGRSPSSRPPRRMGPLLAFGALALLVLWGVLSSFYTLDISEEGVVTRFGAYVRTTGSGFHFKLPFGFEEVTIVQSKKILQEEFGFRTIGDDGERTQYSKDEHRAESLMLTGDLNVADVEWILQYRIADPWKYLFHARDVRRNLRDLSLSIMRRVVGDRLVGDVLTTGRVEIADQAKALTQEVLDKYDMGIKVERIILQGVNPPETVKPAFNEVNAAKQEQEQMINVAEREYNKVIPEARGTAEKLMSDAEGYAIDVVNRAKGDAAQFEEVRRAYKQAPDVTRRRLYIDAMEAVFLNASEITLVDPDVKGVLPLFGGQVGALPADSKKMSSAEPSAGASAHAKGG